MIIYLILVQHTQRRFYFITPMQFNLHLNHNVQFHKLPPSNSNFNPTPKFTRFLLSPVKTIILNPTHFSFATSHPIISEEKYTLLHTHARKSASGAFRAAQSSTHISTYKMFCMDCVAPHIMFFADLKAIFNARHKNTKPFRIRKPHEYFFTVAWLGVNIFRYYFYYY